MGWDTASEKVPKAENQRACVCGVRADAQCPQCVQGKCDAGRDGGPQPPSADALQCFIYQGWQSKQCV